jgi:hypothetical protein
LIVSVSVFIFGVTSEGRQRGVWCMAFRDLHRGMREGHRRSTVSSVEFLYLVREKESDTAASPLQEHSNERYKQEIDTQQDSFQTKHRVPLFRDNAHCSLTCTHCTQDQGQCRIKSCFFQTILTIIHDANRYQIRFPISIKMHTMPYRSTPDSTTHSFFDTQRSSAMTLR